MSDFSPQDFGEEPLQEPLTFSIDNVKESIAGGDKTLPDLGMGGLTIDVPFETVDLGEPGKVDLVDYNIPFSSVFTKLRDGSYIPMFENYKGATGNEDRLAKEQSWYSQVGSGLGRLGAKAGMYAMDAVIGTAVGLTDAIGSGEWSDVWDNDFSNWVDDVNKTLDYSLATYKTDDYKSKNILENIFTNPLTFMTGDLADGLAFVAGAAIPEVALGILTGGASLPTSLAKFGGRLGMKSMLKSTARKASKEAALKSTRGFFNGVKAGEMAGNVLKTGAFLARTSNFEASVEARHNYYDAIDTYLNNYQEENGELPDMESLTNFMEEASDAANGVHFTNLAILSVSNLAMFGSTFNIAPKFRASVGKVGDNLFGLSPTFKAGKAVAPKVNTAQKILGNTTRIAKPMVTEGLYEEGLQGVAGKTMQKYLENTYSSEKDPSHDVWSAMSHGFYETYGTKEGWNEIGLGMIIGSLGGTFTSLPMALTKEGKVQPIAGTFSDSYSAKRKELEKQVEKFNTVYEGLGQRVTKSMNHANSAKLFRDELENGETSTADLDSEVLQLEFIRAQEHLKSPDQIAQDYEAVVNATELDEDIVAELGSQEAVEEYKKNSIEQFKSTAKAYTKAKSAVQRLGIKQSFKDSEGNKMLTEDAVTTMLVLGERSKRELSNIGETIDNLMGTTGTYSALNFYSKLAETNQKDLEQLEQDEQKLTELKENFEQLNRSVENLNKRGETGKDVENRRNTVAEQRMLLSQQIIDLEKKISKAEETLGDQVSALDTTLSTEIDDSYNFQTVRDNLDKVKKISALVENMRKNGMTQDASVIESLLTKFRERSDMVRESDNMLRNMADTNFFTSNEWQGVLGSMVGTRYKMSDGFKKVIKDNNLKIDRQLNKLGIRGALPVELTMKTLLEDNQNISDREKFRLESIIRLHLNVSNIINRDLSEKSEQEEILAEKSVTKQPMEGDTIALRRKVEMAEDGNNSIEQIDALIGELLDAVESVRNSKSSTQSKEKAIQEIEDQIEELKQQLESTEQQVSAETEDIQGQIASLEEQKQELENGRVLPKIVNSEDYKRLDELNAKRHSEEGLTQQETEELYQLEEDMDMWLAATGAVAQGYRLSDLIRLRSQLTNTPVRTLEDVQIITSRQKVLAGNFVDKKNNPNYHLSQNYGAVTAVTINDGKEVVISGMSYEELQELAEVDFEQVPNEYENKRGNTVITVQTKDELNANSKIKILPPGENALTVYTTVLRDVGDGVLEPVMSNYGKEFNDKEMQIEVLYDTQEINTETDEKGDIVKLYVDPQDPYNIKLINDYKNAETNKEKKEALEAMRERLVIRTGVRSKLGGVLKSKRKTGIKPSVEAQKFEAMRNQIINDENFLRQITESTEQRELPIEGSPRVKKVWIGMPNQNYRLNEKGQVVVEEKSFTEQDAKKVVDIGYVHKGKYRTRSKREGIDTTFLQSSLNRDKGNSKVPFIVFQKGNRRIAYPVTLKTIERPDTSEMEKLFKSENTAENKVFMLNDMLASYGIDIKKKGQHFDFQNINDEKFLNDRLAQVENMSYFYSLDSWLAKGRPMEEILMEQATIDLNMSNPIHSPKLQIDYSPMKVDMSNYVAETDKKKVVLNKNTKDKVDKEKQEDCPK
jgi:hypothetical protein